MAIRQRHVVANYLKLNTGEKEEYVRLTMGFSELNESFSPVVSSKRYIHQKSATSSISGYEWESAFTADDIKDEKAIEVIKKIAKEELVGEDCEYLYCVVDTDEPGTTDGTFYARQRKVGIVVDEFSDEDGNLQLSGKFVAVTDWEIGEFNQTTKTFTAK